MFFILLFLTLIKSNLKYSKWYVSSASKKMMVLSQKIIITSSPTDWVVRSAAVLLTTVVISDCPHKSIFYKLWNVYYLT